MKIFKATNRVMVTALFVCATYSAQAFEALQCPIGEPMAAWDFNAGDLPSNNTTAVGWNGDHDGIQSIPDTQFKGIKFNYRGKGASGDSTSEWRYKIKQPLSRTWEYMRVYQPVNFYHRHYVKVETPSPLSGSEWKSGDIIENAKGMTATIVEVRNEFLFIKDFYQRFDLNWGNGILLTNKTSGATVEAIDSRNMGTNNKFSAQWQGDYSNAGMIVEFETGVPASGAEKGVGYIRPTVNKSKAHKSSGTVNNMLDKLPGVAFDPRDNGTVVEFVIERIRSSAQDTKDGTYRIWKRTETSTWQLIHENTNVYAWQPENYFDKGYVFGWANSGYSEDTTFYLLGWSLWAEKPTFLP